MKTPLISGVLYVNFGGAKPTNAPVATGLVTYWALGLATRLILGR